MKKHLLFGMAALGMLASCSSDSEVDAPKGSAISFSNAFINKATRAQLTSANIEEFGVFGYMDKMTGVVFNDERVYKEGGVWKYDNLQYWVPVKDYWFAAVAPYAQASLFTPPAGEALPTTALGSITDFVNDGQTDLIFAQCHVKSLQTNNTPVAFTFNHLLSKVRFTFTNGWSNPNTKMVVSDVTISDAYGKGSAVLSTDGTVWTGTDKTKALAFTTSDQMIDALMIDASAKEESGVNFMIPSKDVEYTVSFKVTGYVGDVMTRNYQLTVKIPASVELKPGFSYNFTCELTKDNVDTQLEPIEFTVTEIKDFEEGGSSPVDFPDTTNP